MADKKKQKQCILDACRATLRIPAFCNDYDDEIADVIEAARAELVAGRRRRETMTTVGFAWLSRSTSRPTSVWTTRTPTAS